MNKKTTWKIVTGLCLVAILLPLLSALTSITASADSKAAPYPYAMEAFGQNHSDVYSTASTMTLDGTMSDTEKNAYVMLGNFGQSSNTSDGIFVSDLKGNSIQNLATEFLPREYSIYATYDSDYLYFYYELVSRTYTGSYALAMNLGSNFDNLADPLSGAKTYQMNLSSGGAASGADSGADYEYKQLTSTIGSSTDSSGTYNENRTTYEIKINRSSVSFADGERLYLHTVLSFWNGSSVSYWHYGLPKDLALPTGQTIGQAFTEDYGSAKNYVPHVINMMGAAPSKTYAKPEITSLTATTSDSAYTYTAEYLCEGTGITKKGVLKSATSGIGKANLIYTNEGTNVDGNGAYTFQIADSSFVSLRPYAVYSDGTVVYGDYVTTSNYYYDASLNEYDATYNVLMIGCSFNAYYLDELLQIAKTDNVRLNLCRTYVSGVAAVNTWNWLIHDYTMNKVKGDDKTDNVHTFVTYVDAETGDFIPAGKTVGNNMSMKDCLAWKENLERPEWDFISVQDHYGINESYSFEKCMKESIPYLPNVFRYLEATEPSATLLMHQTWSFQVGFSQGGTMDSLEQQAAEHENIKNTIYTISKMMNPPKTLPGYDYFPVVPSGNAWAIARANPVVGDTLCCKDPGGTTGGDNYHDGTTGGGQYLNACVWYETITGRSCLGNTWRPNEYTLSEARVEVLQAAAHQAVAELYGANYTK